MANKRLKKKQQKQKLISVVSRSGYTLKEIKQIDQAELNKIAKKQINKERRRERENRRYTLLIKNGVSAKDAARMRGWSDKRIDEYLEKKRKAELKKAQVKANLLIYWTDVTEITDTELPLQIRAVARSMTEPELIAEIKTMLYMNGGEIGSYQIHILENDNGMEGFFQDVARIYKGKCERFRMLVEVVYVMMQLLYESMDKYIFINEFIQNIRFFNEQNAIKLANKIL